MSSFVTVHTFIRFPYHRFQIVIAVSKQVITHRQSDWLSTYLQLRDCLLDGSYYSFCICFVGMRQDRNKFIPAGSEYRSIVTDTPEIIIEAAYSFDGLTRIAPAP